MLEEIGYFLVTHPAGVGEEGLIDTSHGVLDRIFIVPVLFFCIIAIEFAIRPLQQVPHFVVLAFNFT